MWCKREKEKKRKSLHIMFEEVKEKKSFFLVCCLLIVMCDFKRFSHIHSSNQLNLRKGPVINADVKRLFNIFFYFSTFYCFSSNRKKNSKRKINHLPMKYLGHPSRSFSTILLLVTHKRFDLYHEWNKKIKGIELGCFFKFTKQIVFLLTTLRREKLFHTFFSWTFHSYG